MYKVCLIITKTGDPKIINTEKEFQEIIKDLNQTKKENAVKIKK